MSDAKTDVPGRSAWIDHIPVRWVEPSGSEGPRRLALLMPNFTGDKERFAGFLADLAADGFVALSFDPWQHGERGTETREEMSERVFGSFRRHMWPILGQTALDALRVLDWAVAELGVEPAFRIGGLSLGGDVAVAVAGLDPRVRKVAAVVATPDWLRPGMHDAFEPDKPLDPGVPDAYARFFYDQLDPWTHRDRYRRGDLAIRFFCGEKDTHVPAEAALRFQAALRQEGSAEVDVQMVPGLAHMDVRDPNRWWPACRSWLAAGE